LPTILIKLSAVSSDSRPALLEDIAVLTGGRPLVQASGESATNIEAGDLGRARQVWANLRDYGIIGGKGDPRRLREHIALLRARLRVEQNAEAHRMLQQRIGKLMGGSATLYIGADAQPQIESRREVAQRAAEALRWALRSGVVAGGGIALLNCRW